jgi:ribosome-associated translation inhibitor RaiA
MAVMDIFERLIEALTVEAGALSGITEMMKSVENFVGQLEKEVTKEKEKLSEQMKDNK